MEVSISFLKEGNYSDYIKSINYSNADYIHYDVMDGKFVENKNLSLKELEKYIKEGQKKLDVHLMVKDPSKYIDLLSLYNVNNITVHKEIKKYKKMINKIKSYGIKAGIAINPETNIKETFDILDKVDTILIMSVHPGKSGQKFIPEVLDKIKILKEELKKRNLNVKIEIDGGVTEEIIPLLKDVDVIVSASYLLDNLDKIDEIKTAFN